MNNLAALSKQLGENIPASAIAPGYTKQTFLEAAASALATQLQRRELTTVNGVTPLAWMQATLTKGITHNLTATAELRALRIQHCCGQIVDVWLLRCLREYNAYPDNLPTTPSFQPGSQHTCAGAPCPLCRQ